MYFFQLYILHVQIAKFNLLTAGTDIYLAAFSAKVKNADEMASLTSEEFTQELYRKTMLRPN